MKANYEIKLEGKERIYQVVFTPNTNYGNFSCKVYTRNEAYAKYRELKALFIDTIPGKLCVYECLQQIDGSYKKNYLCSIRTGKDVDTLAILDNMNKEVRKLNHVYNKSQLEKNFDEVSESQFDLIHCIEILNFHLQEDETKLCKKIIDTQQIACLLRRFHKNTIKDYNDISDDLVKLKTALKRIEGKLKDNQSYRKKSTIIAQGTKKSGAQLKMETYLASIGLRLEDNE